tara:strand:- start:976 stop:1227 length:252 start_codon:yes stop_codon:yes gene_type:complete
MKKEFNYFLAWLLMPILAIRHKLNRVTHYEVLSESFSPQQHKDYIAANAACKALVDTDKYGDFIKLVEHRKNKQPKVIWSIKW